MTGRVAIIDTGCANLRSLVNAVKRLGIDPTVTADAREIKSASRLFLPGVGTAAALMQMIEERHLADTIREIRQPVLGICLGMQALCAKSEETGGVDLLGVIAADVRLMQTGSLPLPHMGWNETFFDEDAFLFKGLKAGTYFYYVHSYAVKVGSYTIARSDYGEAFSAAVGQDNFYGVQFHPEKSGASGARLIANFLEAA
ncbi:MAG TPA: imidazole glycerol phosphate synthase subunit HisH [Sutterella sp.]|nr:imidazole glycerol phosphate synthase subunit HisH [Sutterella sp.]